MTISKTLREYIERTINNKIREKEELDWKKDEEKFSTIRDQIMKIEVRALDECRALIQEIELDPDRYGYTESSTIQTREIYRNRPSDLKYKRFPYHSIHDILQKIYLRIELDEIPKNEILDYVNNYEITDEDLTK